MIEDLCKCGKFNSFCTGDTEWKKNGLTILHIQSGRRTHKKSAKLLPKFVKLQKLNFVIAREHCNYTIRLWKPLYSLFCSNNFLFYWLKLYFFTFWWFNQVFHFPLSRLLVFLHLSFLLPSHHNRVEENETFLFLLTPCSRATHLSADCIYFTTKHVAHISGPQTGADTMYVDVILL